MDDRERSTRGRASRSARGGPRAAGRRLAALALVALALAGLQCNLSPIQGPAFGPEDEPFLAPDLEAAAPPDAPPAHRLILIGDAGDPLPDDPTLEELGRWGDAWPERTTVVFLGDNVYPAGLQPEDRARGEAVLSRLLGATRAPKIFLPGNHDWGELGTALQSPRAVRAQERFIESAPARAVFMPDAGCPGPEARTLTAPGDGLERDLTVIAVDFHWWLLAEDQRPTCGEIDGTDAFLDRLRAELARHRDDHVVVAAHHPLRSGGPHGGLSRGFWTDLGVRIYLRLRGTIQDLWEPDYAEMIAVVDEVLGEHRPLVFAAGHEHSLQVLTGREGAQLEIVSGAGSAERISPVARIQGTLFAHAHPGFVVLDFFGAASGEQLALLQVVATGRDAPVFRTGIDLAPEVEEGSSDAGGGRGPPAALSPEAAPAGGESRGTGREPEQRERSATSTGPASDS